MAEVKTIEELVITDNPLEIPKSDLEIAQVICWGSYALTPDSLRPKRVINTIGFKKQNDENRPVSYAMSPHKYLVAKFDKTGCNQLVADLNPKLQEFYGQLAGRKMQMHNNGIVRNNMIRPLLRGDLEFPDNEAFARLEIYKLREILASFKQGDYKTVTLADLAVIAEAMALKQRSDKIVFEAPPAITAPRGIED